MKQYLMLVTILSALVASTPPVSNNKTKEISAPLSLKNAQEIALANHPDISSSDYQTKAAVENVTEVTSNYFPEITGNAIRAEAKDSTRISATGDFNNPTVYQRTSVGLSVNQMVADFGRTSNLVGAAEASLKAQESQKTYVKERVLFMATKCYYRFLRARKLLKVAEETLKSRQTLLDQISALTEAKLRSDLDMNLAKQNVEEAKVLILKAQNECSASQASLGEALGYGQQIEFKLVEDLHIPSLPKDLLTLLQQAKSQNPQLVMLRSKLSAARLQYQAEQANHYPNVTLIGYAGNNLNRKKTQLASSYATAAININLPIFTGGRITSAAKRKHYEARAIEQQLKERENQFVCNAQLIWNDTQVAYMNINMTKEMAANSAEALELIELGYQVKKNSIVDLRQAYLEKTQADINYTNSIYEYLINLAALEFQLGIKVLAYIYGLS